MLLRSLTAAAWVMVALGASGFKSKIKSELELTNWGGGRVY